MLTVPEGVCACVGCCRVGLAVPSLVIDQASCSCSVVVYFKIPQFAVWLSIVWRTRSQCGVSLVTGILFALPTTWALRDSLLIAMTRRRFIPEANFAWYVVQVCCVIIGIVIHPLLTSSICRTISQRAARTLHTRQQGRRGQRSTLQMD